MDGADARTGLHRDDGLDRHRHVEDGAVAGLVALRLQAIGKAADTLVELAIRHPGDLAVVALEDDRGTALDLGAEVAVEAVMRDVHLAIVEPLVERRLAVVERAGEGFVPDQVLARETPPESKMVPVRLRAHGPVLVHPGDVRLGAECLARRELPPFLKHGIDLARHVFLLFRLVCPPRSRSAHHRASALRSPYDTRPPPPRPVPGAGEAPGRWARIPGARAVPHISRAAHHPLRGYPP